MRVASLASLCTLAFIQTAAAATPLPTETTGAFEAQLHRHQVEKVLVHTRSHSFRVTQKDGAKVTVSFPAAAERQLVARVKGAGVTVKIAKAQPIHHKLRYIIGGVVIVLILLAGAGWLLLRRKRMREDEQGPRAAFSA